MRTKGISFQGLKGTVIIYKTSEDFLNGNARLTQAPLFTTRYTLQESLNGYDQKTLKGSLASKQDIERFLSLIPESEISSDEQVTIQAAGDSKFVVAMVGFKKGILRHELCHALYRCNTLFKADIDAAWEALKPEARDFAESVLREIGYDPADYATEYSAYLVNGFTLQERFKLFTADPDSFQDMEDILREAGLIERPLL